MVSLSEAFRLCGIKDGEIVYLMRPDAKSYYGLFSGKYMVSGRTIRHKTDMKKIKVHRISVQTDCDSEFRGMVFVVDGISEEELAHLEYT